MMASRVQARLAVDEALWPTVNPDRLDPPQREVYERRERALALYLAGQPVTSIEAATGVAAASLARLLKRCQSIHADGRLFGYRGLIPYVRVKTYLRTKAVSGRSASGQAGAFAYLLECHPVLDQLVRKELAARRVLVLGEPDRHRVIGLTALHAKFLRACRDEGLTPRDYPLARDEQGRRALSSYVKTLVSHSFAAAAQAAGAERLKGPVEPQRQEPRLVATRPLEVVEFDGHRIDLRLRIALEDPLTQEIHTFELERIWILVILDVFSRAVLSYHLVLDRQYSRHDVIRVVEKALIPHRPRSFVIPKLEYPAQGGYPNAQLPELAYACWDRFCFDNAKAHLAEDTLRVLCEFVGCVAHLGPIHDPDERPFIERFFGTFTRHLAHRLPGAAPSSPAALRRLLAKSPALVTLDELEDLVELMLARYNGTPHSSLNGRTPLEQLEHSLRNRHSPLRWLAAPRRRQICLLQTPHRSVVRGNLAHGVRPYIHLFGARYTNAVLAGQPSCLGETLSVYYNPDDLRTVQAFWGDGTELGTLTAAHPWTRPPHTLKLRREILRLRRAGTLRYRDADDPVEAYLAYQRQQAGGKRQAANKLAEVQRLKQSAAPPLPDSPPPGAAAADDTAVIPDILPIGTGHVF